MSKRIQLKNKAGTQNLNPVTTSTEVYVGSNKTLAQWISEHGGGLDGSIGVYRVDDGVTPHFARAGQIAFNISDIYVPEGYEIKEDDFIICPANSNTYFVGSVSSTECVVEYVTRVSEKYTKPYGGIPSSDMASSVQTSLTRANTLTDAYINNLIDAKVGVIENGSY